MSRCRSQFVQWIRALFLLLFVASITARNSPASPYDESLRRPNIVLILVDDLGYGDLGCCGATDLRTPHLDAMASEGMRFTDFSVVAPLCTPSRVALMTGRYPVRSGLATGVLRPNAENGLPASEWTLAEVARSAGYVTGCIGKWHLGFRPGMRPLDQGFDSYYGVLHNLDKVETVFFDAEGGMPILRQDTVEKRPAVPSEMTSLYTAEALKFIDSHASEPFFLYIGHAMPHLPFDASAGFRGRSQRGLYGDVVEELDDSVGQILNRLKQPDLAGRTLVIFTSDNGPERRTTGSAGNLRGSKHTVYEGGLRVPCIAWWPGHVPAGIVSDEFLTTLEVLPTFARLLDVGIPEQVILDGHDVSGVLLGTPGSHSPRTSLFATYGYLKNSTKSWREGPWKLHLKTPPELYNLRDDPTESRNVAEQEAVRVAAMLERCSVESPDFQVYAQEIQRWREENERQLRAPYGWLSLTGHYWLKDGSNAFGADDDADIRIPDGLPGDIRGEFQVDESGVTLDCRTPGVTVNDKLEARARRLTLDPLKAEADSPDRILLGERVRLQLVRRSGRLAVRVRDPLSERITRFTGKRWFPVRPDYRVQASFSPYDPPRTVSTTNVRGDRLDMELAGLLTFSLHGQTCELEAVREAPGELFLVFRDATSGKTTYGSCRFLNTAEPVDGSVELDFNKATNPPCAFSPFTLCPLPPRRNILSVAVEAGEMAADSSQ